MSRRGGETQVKDNKKGALNENANMTVERSVQMRKGKRREAQEFRQQSVTFITAENGER